MIVSLLQDDHYLISNLAFIGTRRTTDAIEASVLRNAAYAAEKGYVLISGGAKGVDSLSEESNWKDKIIITANDGARLSETDINLWKEYEKIASVCHPNWDAVRYRGWYVTNLMVRNVIIVDYADAVLAWPSSDRKGGTEHGITVARYLGKPLEIVDV